MMRLPVIPDRLTAALPADTTVTTPRHGSSPPPSKHGPTLARLLRSNVSVPASSPAQLWAGIHLPQCESAEKLEQLASRALRFTPRVSLVSPDGLLLEVKGSLQLFAGLAALRDELFGEVVTFHREAVLAFAPTPLAALTVARAGRSLEITDPAQLIGQLASLPITALRWPQETLARLTCVGARTIGAVLRLPRAGFARRFGSEPLAMLDVLTGRAPQALETFHPRACFRRRRDFDCELSQHGLLRAALAPLFADLDRFLRARQCGVVELECRLQYRYAPPTLCALPLAEPTADAARLAALLGERLDALQLPEPVRACELYAAALLPHQPPRRCLWQPGEHGGEAGPEGSDLIERLRARLGPRAVHGLGVRAEHRPEAGWTLTGPPPAVVPRGGVSRKCAVPGGTAGEDTVHEPPLHRPLWILPTPQPLTERDGLPRRRGTLRLASEPERIESGWWDGAEVARDYYTAIDIHGVRLWVFRERTAPHGWFLHGVFG
jgi:protein ImuB